MNLDYSTIFSLFADLLKTTFPISLFLYLAKMLIHFFYATAFPKFYNRD